ncbi:protein of unknown function (plasmid) [Cupriavidus taiwanensis]|nr:protein of unknown function [Cupriavidus taiwanensis]
MFAEINADQRDFTHGSLPPRSNASSLGDASGDRADHFIMSGCPVSFQRCLFCFWGARRAVVLA